MTILSAAVLIAALASPQPSASPVGTVYLSYNTPDHGYQSHTTATIGASNVTVDQRVDAYNNREADIAIDYQGKALTAHYVIMDGLIYERAPNGTWTLPLTPPAGVALLLLGTYEPSSTFDAAGRVVANRGTGPCGASTCDLYLASRPGKLNDKPIVTISHLAIDPAARLLVSNDSSTFDAAGNKTAQFTSSYSGFDGQHLTIPAMTIASSSPDQCNTGDSSNGPIALCLRHTSAYDFYALTIGNTLVLRARADNVTARALSSPVMDDVTLHCAQTMAAQDVDQKLAAQLKASGMSDAQIQSNLGQKQTASDCTVTIAGATALTAHYDLK